MNSRANLVSNRTHNELKELFLYHEVIVGGSDRTERLKGNKILSYLIVRDLVTEV